MLVHPRGNKPAVTYVIVLNDMKKIIILLQIVTILPWAFFLYIDYFWQEILKEAVTNGFYGEIYGPLSFFRPIFLYSAIALTILNSILFVIIVKKKERF